MSKNRYIILSSSTKVAINNFRYILEIKIHISGDRLCKLVSHKTDR